MVSAKDHSFRTRSLVLDLTINVDVVVDGVNDGSTVTPAKLGFDIFRHTFPTVRTKLRGHTVTCPTDCGRFVRTA